MPRLLFEKTGRAVWISHLDLMRLFQRAFKRAGLPLKHTQGFNPRPSVSIALPLSVGVESKCELLDFELDGCEASGDEIMQLLNPLLVEGVKVLSVYDRGNKIGNLSFLRCLVTLEYDVVPDGACEAISALFNRTELLVPKKTKSGVQEQDIIPMIRSINVIRAGENAVKLDALICCQNPTLNPAQLPLAIEIFLPEFKPNYSKCERIEIFDKDEKLFR